MDVQTGDSADRPEFLAVLEAMFGAPSHAGFGSSVFFVPAAQQSQSLEADARAKYRYFVGNSWEQLGAQNWINGWSTVFERRTENSSGILVELRSITDREARQSAGLLLENMEDSQQASRLLQQAFDHERVTELRVFKIGDGAAMSGVIIAARLQDLGSLFLVLLLD